MGTRSQQPALAELQPQGALNLRFQLVFAVTGQPVNGPGFIVPPGAQVNLRTVNGAAVNANACSIGDYPEQLGTSTAMVLPPGADVTVPWPCNNLSQIWASGTAADGLLITLLVNSVG